MDMRAAPAASPAARERVWKLDSGRPDTCQTSSARWMRWLSPGASRAAVCGSTRASSACRAGQPSAAACASSRARTAASAGGMSSIPSHSALKYSIVPPPAAAGRHAPGFRARAAARRPRIRPRCRAAADRGCRSGGVARPPARRPSAWPCRCPCRGTPAPNPRSRFPRAGAARARGPGPAPRPSCPMRWGLPARGRQEAPERPLRGAGGGAGTPVAGREGEWT